MFYGPFRNFHPSCFLIKASKPKLFDVENLQPGKLLKNQVQDFQNDFGTRLKVVYMQLTNMERVEFEESKCRISDCAEEVLGGAERVEGGGQGTQGQGYDRVTIGNSDCQGYC